MDNDMVTELTTNTGQTHSKHVLTMIDTVLTLGGMTPRDLDAFAVTRGPGSFTGLRIGLSVVKGMALVTQKPVLGISSLDALAYQSGSMFETVQVMLDARRKEVYFARYAQKNGRLGKVGEETVGPIDKMLADINSPSLFIGSGALLYQTRISDKCGPNAFFPPKPDHVIRASSVGYLGLEQIQDTEDTNSIARTANVTPKYIRASDAEINKKKKPL